jgi:type I restriction enzyme, S subunit
MAFEGIPFSHLLSNVVDNRGRTCPTADEGIPLIATNCIRNELMYPTYDKVRFVSRDTYATWFRGHPRPGDIIFVNKATPGRVCLVPDPVDFCIAQDMVAVRADPNKVYPKYLFAALRSLVVQEQIAQMHVGTLIPHFKKGDFDKLLVPVPSPGEQQFIGDIYFDLSAKIDLNRRMNETLEAMARALFKSWFIDFDPVRRNIARRSGQNQPSPDAPRHPLPLGEGQGEGGIEHLDALFPDSFEDSELGEIPKGWAVATLASVSTLNPEVWTKATRPARIQYIDLSNTKWGRIESVTQYAATEAPSRAQRVLRPGDTIVGTVRPGNGSYALISEAGLTGSTGFAVLRPKLVECVEFVYFSATAGDNIDALSHLADGGAYPAVRPEVVSARPIVHPQQGVLKTFSNIAAPLLAKIADNERESRTLATLRDTLLPKLVSSELGVPETERAVQGVAV